MIPKLRFPEFKEEWILKNLGDIAILVRDRAGINSYQLMSITAGVGLVSQIEKFGREIAGESYKNYYVIKKGDFAYNKSSTKQFPEGQIAVLENADIAAVPNSIFTCFRVNPKFVLHYFLKYPFDNNIHGIWLRKFIEVGARAHGALSVDIKDLFATPIYFPNLPEQQKIAATLSSLDDLITAQSEKIKALQAHKKSLMQQLFPAEGERVPRLRFPEFWGAGDWEEKKLGDLAEIITGSTPSTNDPKNYDGNKMFVSPADINEYRYVTQTKITLSEIGYSKTRNIKANSILFVCIGSTIGKIAQNKFECATNQQINSLIPNNQCLNDFIYSALEFNSKKISQFAGIQAVPIINKTIFSCLVIKIPKIPEQQKIATTLSSLDDLIKTQNQKLEALKKHKKGLMQQLFPNPIEETV